MNLTLARLLAPVCSVLLFCAHSQAQSTDPAEQTSAPAASSSETSTCKTLVPVYDPKRGPLPTRQEYREVDVQAKEAPSGSKCPLRPAGEEPPR